MLFSRTVIKKRAKVAVGGDVGNDEVLSNVVRFHKTIRNCSVKPNSSP